MMAVHKNFLKETPTITEGSGDGLKGLETVRYLAVPYKNHKIILSQHTHICLSNY